MLLGMNAFTTDVAIDCYQCSSQKSTDCTDVMIYMGALHSQNCNNTFEAQYCIKSISLDGNNTLMSTLA